MKLFISHQSALEYWRSCRGLPGNSAHRRCRVVLPDKLPSIEPLMFSGLNQPIHITIRNQSARRVSTEVMQHVFGGHTPVGCFMNVGNGLMVSSPEFCFLQMADQMTIIELIELGYELCGVYSLPLANDPAIPEKGFYDRQPLTSIKQLRVFLDSMPGVKRRKKALRALHYLQNGSASPMETKLSMFLTLPYKMGGYGFTMPKLNSRVTLSKTARKHFSKDYYICDLFWPDKKLAVEYDSDLYHTGSDRITNDSKRRNALASVGISVVSVTKQQLFSRVEFEKVVRTIAKHLGKRLLLEKSSHNTTHYILRKQLL